MSSATSEEVLRPHAAVETAFLAPEAVLWDARHQQVHHLNPSASAVWLCIDGEMSAGQIATELAEIFEMPRHVIQPDVNTAIAEFVRLGLLDGGENFNGDTSREALHEQFRGAPANKPSNGAKIAILARPPDT